MSAARSIAVALMAFALTSVAMLGHGALTGTGPFA